MHYSLSRVDILCETKIMSPAFLDPIKPVLGKNMGLCDFVVDRLRDDKILLDVTLYTPAQVCTF